MDKDFLARRRAQISEDDPTLRVAETITSLLRDNHELGAASLLVACELSVRALLEIVRKEHGVIEVNNTLVDAQHKMREYDVLFTDPGG